MDNSTVVRVEDDTALLVELERRKDEELVCEGGDRHGQSNGVIDEARLPWLILVNWLWAVIGRCDKGVVCGIGCCFVVWIWDLVDGGLSSG
ncbi:hypothetical protein M0R45_015839 [Rubus argutus]|uniref:Transmembrane protein n=1 Tax=Rubus argutus TaxID=59490 RepID=A0AAW1XQU6_RUBAR